MKSARTLRRKKPLRLERLEPRRVMATLAINAGGPAVGDFLADQFFSGGGTFGPGNGSISPIDTSGVSDPAPAAVYQTERTGNGGSGGAFAYRIPNLIAGETYTLRLHFAEIFFEQSGSRIFDVQINGQSPPALDDYDVFVESGDQGADAERVVIEEFTVTPNAQNELLLEFTASVNNAKLSALELIGEFGDPPDSPPLPGSIYRQVADTPISVFEGQGAALGDNLYLFGGFVGGLDVTRESHVYNTTADAWTRVADFPALTEEIVQEDGQSTGQFISGGITHGVSAVDGDNIYVVGGFVGAHPGQATRAVTVYDTQADAWIRTTDLPAPRGSGGVAIVGRQLHYFGGGTRTAGIAEIHDRDDHWVLDLGPTDSPLDDATEWVRAASLPLARNHLGSAAIDGLVYAVGGQLGDNDATQNQSRLDVYDPATDRWTRLADLPIPLGHLMTNVTVADGKLIVVGGVTNNGLREGLGGSRRTATVFSYDPATDEWSRLAWLPAERQSPLAAVVNDELIVASGLNAQFQRTSTTFAVDVPTLLASAPESPDANVLFVRGADRSGGFFEFNPGDSESELTEQLSDVFNTATNGGNHGWGELRQALEGAGFSVEQLTETAENASGQSDGIHLDFERIDLARYSAIVFGSNNAVYDTAAIDSIEDYVRGGGSALFISDANFGSDWADASNSDQQFLDRFGLIAHQDQGTYAISRAAGDFDVPDHPIFTGVDAFDGEGVTPVEVGSLTAGVAATILANSEGLTRLNNGTGGNNQGTSRPSGPDDAALVIATADEGRIAGHYDRNTFFNLNGAGTNINRLDNRQYALNLFGWLVGAFEPLPGDYDGNRIVDRADYNVWVEGFGEAGTNLPADGNGDGVVNTADYAVWRDNLGASGPDVQLTVPPTAVVAEAAITPAAVPVLASPATLSPQSADADSLAVATPEETLLDPTLLLHTLASGVDSEPAEEPLSVGDAPVDEAFANLDEEATDLLTRLVL